jgi:hypothetical protein
VAQHDHYEGFSPEMSGDCITLEAIDELLRFLPLFDVPQRKYVKAWAGGEVTPDGAITIPFPEYCDDVLEFFRLAGRACWSDSEYDPREARTMLSNDQFISTCSLNDIKTLLTYCVRGERFSDGHWASVLKTGRVIAILRRLAVLRETLE